MAEVELMARRLTIARVIVATTNDNLPSLYFYQRHGYRVCEWLRDTLEHHVPAVGFAGIPIRDEIRLEKRL